MYYLPSTTRKYKIVSCHSAMECSTTHGIAVYWNADIPTEIADQMMLTSPVAVSRLVNMLVLNRMAKAEPERFDALEKAGFKVIRYGDIIYQVFERFGGHYMDVGASAKVAHGLVRYLSMAFQGRWNASLISVADGYSTDQSQIGRAARSLH